jgi:chromate transporter
MDPGQAQRGAESIVPVAAPRPALGELVRVFARIGLLGFGGPAGQVALMHRELVEERRWLSDEEFLHGLNFCHLLPGPEAQQLATYAGWRLGGARGGLAAGLLFVLPGALVMLVLSAVYVLAAGGPLLAGAFLGVKAAVLAVVAQALARVAGRALDARWKRGVALASLVALSLAEVPFPAVVLAAAVVGALFAGRAAAPSVTSDAPRPGVARTLATATGWGLAWVAPVVLVRVALGEGHVLWRLGVFFARLAASSFGGAYAALAYMAQQAVETQGWLAAGEMADGLGLAETTPGPLILVTQFVGFVAAWRAPGGLPQGLAALLGAGLTTWVVFAPSFLWIFALAPWVERLRASRRLASGLAAITASTVGVLGSLALWFAGHVLFPRGGVDVRASAIALVAGVLLVRLRRSVGEVVGVAAVLGMLLGLARA